MPTNKKKDDEKKNPEDEKNEIEVKSNDPIVDKRLKALRVSRETEPGITNKQRLEYLQALDPTLWSAIDIKKFRKLVHKDNKFLRETTQLPPGTFRVPVKPYPGCAYPCQLCGTPLKPGIYDSDNIQFCRPDGDWENKSLQWALDSDLYECAYRENRTMLIACTNCTLPQPWGDGSPITSTSLSTDYKNPDKEYQKEMAKAMASLPPQYAQMLAAMGGMNIYNDDELEDERAMNHGFTQDEMDDLLCQGVKPWDDDAGDVLAALHGYDDYY